MNGLWRMGRYGMDDQKSAVQVLMKTDALVIDIPNVSFQILQPGRF